MFKKIPLVLLICLIIITVGVFISYKYVESSVRNEHVPGNLPDYSFSITSGEGVSSILARLQSHGFIKNSAMLSVYLKLYPEYVQDIQAGEYTVTSGISVLELLQSLRGGSFEQKLTFIEGWRREQYLTYLVDQKGEDFAHIFDELTKDDEGRLFPDTYFIDANTTPASLAADMKSNFSTHVDEINDREDLTQGQLIIASIVEREVISDADRALVAGILLKRLDEGMNLGADATLQYALANNKITESNRWDVIQDKMFKWWPQEITADDLQLDSPYNTRLYIGIPPTPICNPGLAAIRAVVAPIISEYYYYITDREGITRYAATLDEHNHNIATYGLMQ
ncbi:endolytic transglycosylase MltG [candidate division WWE3 bacterium]|nr:endolytic transglycosylase MltG [candidate division WWE3 bacterium]